MLASITPLGERGRHSHFAVTVTAFAIGATVAGAALGLALGALGGLLPAGLRGNGRLVIGALALLAAVAVDVAGATVPGPRRQVDERWLDRYRGWVYGLGYGSQLGLGIVTVVISAATYAALLCALLAGGPLAGGVVLGIYGALRGLTPLAAAHVRTPRQLVALHGRLARVERAGAHGGAIVLAAAALAGLVSVLA